MEYISVKTPAEIKTFYEKTNSLHDGHVISVNYSNSGISRNSDGCLVDEPYKNELVIKVMVTSLWDRIVELKFTGVLEYQLKEYYTSYIYSADINVDDHGFVIWSDEPWKTCDPSKMSFVKAINLEWRILNYVNMN